MAISKTQTLQYRYPPDPVWNLNSPESMVQYFHRELREQRQAMEELTSEMIHLKGFYSWLMHAYPETLIQYKAIQELQRAAGGDRVVSSKEAQAKMAMGVQP